MAKLPDVEYSAELVESARGWILDCVWGDLDEDEIRSLPATTVMRGIEKHYEGGIVQFIEDGA